MTLINIASSNKELSSSNAPASLVRSQRTKLALISLGFIMLAGCASTPVPNEQLAVTKAAVESASREGATEYAPLEMKMAREKLEAANMAVSRDENEKAGYLAAEAQLDARLAETKAQKVKIDKGNAEVEKSTDTFMDEVNRVKQQEGNSNQNRTQ